MQNLGKLAIILMLNLNTWAKVSADVDQSAITPGNIVTFSLHVSDTRFQKPSISTLCGVSVLATSSQTSVTGVNGKFTKTQTLSYSFAPQHSCTINPIEIKTDAGVVKTAPIKIDVHPLSKEAKEKFSLLYTGEKKEVYVGEPFSVILNSKIRRDMKVIDSKFEPSDMNGFWIKKQQQEPQSTEGDYVNTKITYVLAAQQAGEMTLKPASMNLAQQAAANDFLGGVGNEVKWSRYLSNSYTIKAKPLPAGIDIVGHDLELQANLDKIKVNQNEAVNMTLTLSGSANFEDLGALKPFMANVSVFEDDAKVEHFIKDGVYKSEYVKKIAFVGDKSFTIPPIEIKYFDTKTASIKTLRTQAYHVEVLRQVKGEKNGALKIEKGEKEQSKPFFENFTQFTSFAMALSAFFGFLLGVAVMFFKPFFNKEKHEKLVSNRDLKLLLTKLMAFKEDAEVRDMIEVLEQKIYLKKVLQLDKSKLQELRKRYKL